MSALGFRSTFDIRSSNLRHWEKARRLGEKWRLYNNVRKKNEGSEMILSRVRSLCDSTQISKGYIHLIE